MDHIGVTLFLEDLRLLLAKHNVEGVSGIFFIDKQALVTYVTQPGVDKAVYDLIRELLSRIVVTTPGASLCESGAIALYNKPDTGEMPH